MLWRLFDQCPFQPLVNKQGKVAIPALDQLVQSWNHYKLVKSLVALNMSEICGEVWSRRMDRKK